MVEDRTLEIKEKLNKCLKHFAYPGCRCTDVSAYMDNVLVADIRTPEGTISVPIDTSKDVKEIVKSVIECRDLKRYRQVIILNVEVDETRLTLDNIPDDFIISGLPYRQLKISIGERPFFIDLCAVSYQHVYSLMLSQSHYPACINFKNLKSCLKRKELLVLLITLSTN